MGHGRLTRRRVPTSALDGEMAHEARLQALRWAAMHEQPRRQLVETFISLCISISLLGPRQSFWAPSALPSPPGSRQGDLSTGSTCCSDVHKCVEHAAAGMQRPMQGCSRTAAGKARMPCPCSPALTQLGQLKERLVQIGAGLLSFVLGERGWAATVTAKGAAPAHALANLPIHKMSHGKTQRCGQAHWLSLLAASPGALVVAASCSLRCSASWTGSKCLPAGKGAGACQAGLRALASRTLVAHKAWQTARRVYLHPYGAALHGCPAAAQRPVRAQRCRAVTCPAPSPYPRQRSNGDRWRGCTAGPW